MEYYNTLVEALNALRQQGYVVDFNLKKNHLEYDDGKLFHDDFDLDKFFRFEGESNPDDSSILYAISSKKYKLKGVLVNAYSIYSNPISDEMMRKFK
jgi:hypothetical protein